MAWLQTSSPHVTSKNKNKSSLEKLDTQEMPTNEDPKEKKKLTVKQQCYVKTQGNKPRITSRPHVIDYTPFNVLTIKYTVIGIKTQSANWGPIKS